MKLKFETEEQMKQYVITRLLNDITQLFDKTKTKIIEEVPYATGQTDLVVVNVSKKYLHRRIYKKNLVNSIDNINYLKIYLRLKEMIPINKDEFLSQYIHNKHLVSRALNWLDINEYIYVSDNTIKLVNCFNKHITAVCAFELKLSNWRVALKQASRAKSFSHMQFVVLDDKYISGAIENKFLFKKLNIGLISISPNSKCKVHYYPVKSKPFSKLGEWRLNELVMQEVC